MEDTGKPNIHIYKILDHCRTFPFVPFANDREVAAWTSENIENTRVQCAREARKHRLSRRI